MTLRGAANLPSASGNELNLTPQNPIATQVPGPLNSTWYQPFGGIDDQFAKHWTARAMWDYYGYHENASTAYSGPACPAKLGFRFTMCFELSEGETKIVFPIRKIVRETN
jgi:hypothetical protein